MKTHSIFGDRRLDREYTKIITDISAQGTGVINRVCVNMAQKKAAYRFINNPGVTVERIEQDLINQSIDTLDKLNFKEVLVAQDTMETVRDSIVKRLEKKGKTALECSQTHKGARSHSAILMNSESGVPVGFGYLKIWGRIPKPLAEVKAEDLRADRKQQPAYYLTDS